MMISDKGSEIVYILIERSDIEVIQCELIMIGVWLCDVIVCMRIRRNMSIEGVRKRQFIKVGTLCAGGVVCGTLVEDGFTFGACRGRRGLNDLFVTGLAKEHF